MKHGRIELTKTRAGYKVITKCKSCGGEFTMPVSSKEIVEGIFGYMGSCACRTCHARIKKGKK